jgi:hypothetical protein
MNTAYHLSGKLKMEWLGVQMKKAACCQIALILKPMKN